MTRADCFRTFILILSYSYPNRLGQLQEGNSLRHRARWSGDRKSTPRTLTDSEGIPWTCSVSKLARSAAETWSWMKAIGCACSAVGTTIPVFTRSRLGRREGPSGLGLPCRRLGNRFAAVTDLADEQARKPIKILLPVGVIHITPFTVRNDGYFLVLKCSHRAEMHPKMAASKGL